MKKKAIIVIAFVAILIIGLYIFASNPIISCKVDVPENYLEAIESQSKGTYSNVLPLVPIYVTVNSLEAETVYYTIHYFPFGSVGMSYTESDGYNIEKPLTGLS